MKPSLRHSQPLILGVCALAALLAPVGTGALSASPTSTSGERPIWSRSVGALLQEDTLTVRTATYPSIISGHACVEGSASHRIYCFGGIYQATTNAPETDMIVEYDPVTDTTSQKAAVLPTRRTNLACAEDSSSEMVYCFGGRAQDFVCTQWDGDNCVGGTSTSYLYDDILRYHPATDSLSTISTTLPAPLSDLACSQLSSSNKIYCFGGHSSGYLDQILEFNPATESVTVMSATLPSGRYGLSCAEESESDLIYCFGGKNGGGKLNEIVEYDPTADSLITRSAIFPSRITELACAEDSSSHLIYCSGGMIQSVAYVDAIYAYDPSGDELSVMNATLPSGRYGLACAEDSANHHIYCLGGSRNVVAIDEITEYTPGTGGSPICPDRDDDYHFDASCGGTDCDDDPFACGFACNLDKLEECDGYDNNCDGQIDEGDTCQVIGVKSARLPWASSHLSCAATADNSIYCLGGGDNDDEIVQYIPSTDTHVEKSATLPGDRWGLSCATDTSSDLIYCFGGGTSATSVLAYNPSTDSLAARNAAIPSPRNRLSCTESSASHRIYCFGGTQSQSVNFDEILEYDPQNDLVVSKVARLPQARSGLSCAEDSLTHLIYCFGGYLWSGLGGPPYFREIFEYDPATDTLAVVSSQLPVYGREGLGCAEDRLNHYIFCFGGYNHMLGAGFAEQDFFDEILRYDPASDTLMVEGLRLPTRRGFLPCVQDSSSHRIYCFGGSASPGTWVYYDEITEFTPPGVTPVNRPPRASNDSYGTWEGSTLSQGAPGVLANDTDADGDSLTASLASDPSHGTLELSSDGSFTFTPLPGYVGADTFTYRANDGSDDSNLATVTIEVTSVNHPPVAVGDVYWTSEGSVLNVPAPGVLGNDTDSDGDALTAVPVGGPSTGTLTLNPDGSFLYTPAPGFAGTASFTYRANDGAADSAEATVTVKVGTFIFADGFESGDTTAWSVSAP